MINVDNLASLPGLPTFTKEILNPSRKNIYLQPITSCIERILTEWQTETFIPSKQTIRFLRLKATAIQNLSSRPRMLLATWGLASFIFFCPSPIINSLASSLVVCVALHVDLDVSCLWG